MEEQDDNLELSKRTQERIDKSIEELNTEKELKIMWKKELLSNKSFMNYLEGFHPSSTEDAIEGYLQQKYMWHKYADMYKKIIESDRSKWIDAAFDGLEAILQKKLFDLQCLWRANEVKLEGVEICYDFNVYENDIFNCTFLEPISMSDIVMYQDFLTKGDLEYERFISWVDWQDYDEIKSAYQSDNLESAMPEWYEFHNQRTGNTKLLLLPDIKGDLEEFYIELWRENERKLNPPKVNPQSIVIDTRPIFNYYDKNNIAYIVSTFDTKEAQNGHRYYSEGFRNNNDEDEFYEEIFEELLKVKEFVPIAAHYNFKEALENAYQSYRCKKIAEHLPIAFEQYQFNRQMGLFNPKQDPDAFDLRGKYEKMILGGRELNGEPRDFNF